MLGRRLVGLGVLAVGALAPYVHGLYGTLAEPHARLSHEGLYINLPHVPQLTLYMDSDALPIEGARLSVSTVRVRSAADIAQCHAAHAPDTRSIEACEQSDLSAPSLPLASVHTLRRADQHPDGGLRVPGHNTGPLAALYDSQHGPGLRSVVLTLRTAQANVTRKTSWWLGHLVMPRAPWPIAAGDAATRDGHPPPNITDGPWDGRAVRVSGTMHDPLLPRSRKQSFWPLGSWSRGLTVRVADKPYAVPFRSPVAGTVVWSAPYRDRHPPLEGAEAGANDEVGWCVIVRDVFHTLFVLRGIELGAARVRVGDRVEAGDVLGTAPRAPPSGMPPSTAPPADPPRRWEEQGYAPFPYRFRRLELRVARSPCLRPGEACFADERHATYFPPQWVLRAPPRASLRPWAEPGRMYITPASPPPYTSTPLALPQHTSTPLTGRVEVLAPFAAWEATPDTNDDALDPVAVYALEWAAVPYTHEALCASHDVYWRRAFEHSRLPSVRGAWLNDSTYLLAHYVPTLVVRSAAGHAFRTQLKSQYDEKERALVYAATRTRLGAPHLGGAWDTAREPTRGVHRVAVRAWDTRGHAACVETTVRLSDAPPTAGGAAWRTWPAARRAVLPVALLGLPAAASNVLARWGQLLWSADE